MSRNKPNFCSPAWIGGLSLAVVLAVLAWGWFTYDEKAAPADNEESLVELETGEEFSSQEHGNELSQDATRDKAKDHNSSDKSINKTLNSTGNQNSNALDQDTSRGRRDRTSARRSNPPYRNQRAREEHGRRAGR